MLMNNVRIDAIDARESQKTGKPYFSIVTDKGKFSCFDEDLVADLKIGLVLDFEYVQSGAYKNLKAAFPSSSVAAKSETSSAGPVHAQAPRYSNDGQRVGMAINNAFQVMLSPHGQAFVKDGDVNIMQGVARIAAETINLAKQLEKGQ